jgi:hypothetical protein
MTWLGGHAGEVRLSVRAQPGAKRSALVGQHGDRLKVAVSAPPVDGKANEALCAFVAAVLGLPQRAVVVSAGYANRDKALTIHSSLGYVRDAMAAALVPGSRIA